MAESPGRSSSDSSSSSSSDFEFWMFGKEPSIPQPRILTADELFLDGVLLPLHLLPLAHPNSNSTTRPPSETEPETPPPPPDSSTSTPPTSSSKRWKDILKAGERKLAERVRKKERRESVRNAAELNINIWPFSRSRSAGNAGNGTGNRARVMGARSKASSAPCSRSNSLGESPKPAATTTSSSSRRRWPPNAGRVRLNGGIHLGRTSPVRQLRRNCKPPEPEVKTHGSDGGDAKKGGGGGGIRMLSLNMNTCIKHRNQVNCSGEGKDGVAGGDRSARSVRVGSHAGLSKLRAIFSKKVL